VKTIQFALRLSVTLSVTLLVAMAALSVGTQLAEAQATPSPDGVPVKMVVTVASRHGSDMPNIGVQDVLVYQGRTRVKVTDWVPLQGDNAGLEFFILLDDGGDTSRGSRLDDVRNFIRAQPPTTKIGIAYMQTGGPKVEQALTADHALAAKALHISVGGLANSASPYTSLTSLLKQWPAGNDHREVLMISNGVDGEIGDVANLPGQQHDPYAETAIEKSQVAGVIAFTIDTSSPDSGTDRMNPSTHYLSQIAEETGGASYYNQAGAAISFAPYLDDLTHRLTHQYLLTFLPKPQKKAGMQEVKVKTEVAHAELVSADKVYVPAAR